MTADDAVTRALQMAGVRAAETPITAAEMADGINLLNDMLAEWEGSGIQLGHVPITSSSDVLQIPDVCNMAVKTNLSIYMHPEYGKQVNPALAAAATDAYTQMLNSLVKIGDVSPPGTLPMGSGNKDYEGTNYFPSVDKVNF